jgi:hypothetical protein
MQVAGLTSSPLRRRLNAIVANWQRLLRIAGDSYRPELHYMRGPGPKWRAKHRGASVQL